MMSARPSRLPSPDRIAFSRLSPFSRSQAARSSMIASVGAPPRIDLPSAAMQRASPPPLPSNSTSSLDPRRMTNCSRWSSSSPSMKPTRKPNATLAWSRFRAAMMISRLGWSSHAPTRCPSASPADTAVLAFPRPIDRTPTITPSASAPRTNLRWNSASLSGCPASFPSGIFSPCRNRIASSASFDPVRESGTGGRRYPATAETWALGPALRLLMPSPSGDGRRCARRPGSGRAWPPRRPCDRRRTPLAP